MERFTRITPQEEETVMDTAKTNGPEIPPPESEPAVPHQPAPQPPLPQPPPPQQQQMPESITIPMQQFIQLQQQLQHAKELKPLPQSAMTEKASEHCVQPGMPGHQIETRVIHQTQNVGSSFVEITQTLVLCVRCGASLAQIRGSLGM